MFMEKNRNNFESYTFCPFCGKKLIVESRSESMGFYTNNNTNVTFEQKDVNWLTCKKCDVDFARDVASPLAG